VDTLILKTIFGVLLDIFPASLSTHKQHKEKVRARVWCTFVPDRTPHTALGVPGLQKRCGTIARVLEKSGNFGGWLVD